METVVCNNCGEQKFTVALTGPDWLHGLPGSFTLVRCQGCGLLYLNPRPVGEELAAYYPSDYEAHIGTRKMGWLKQLEYDYGIQKRYRGIMRYTRPGRMLDIGCATGDFLAGMEDRGWEVMGIEPSEQASRYARETLGLNVQTASLEEAQLDDNSLDLITMWNVLEHLPDPAQALGRIARALKPGGLLVFAIPSLRSYDVKWFKKYWAGYDLPRHLYTFPEGVMEQMVSRQGFKVLGRKCIYGTYNALAFSARFALRDKVSDPQRREFYQQMILSRPARLLMWPVAAVISMLNRGTIMTWFCRKTAA